MTLLRHGSGELWVGRPQVTLMGRGGSDKSGRGMSQRPGVQLSQDGEAPCVDTGTLVLMRSRVNVCASFLFPSPLQTTRQLGALGARASACWAWCDLTQTGS